MEKFLSRGKDEELVCVSVKMSRAMYAQLVQQKFQAQNVIQCRVGVTTAKRDGVEGKGSRLEAFIQNLERSGYFEGLLPGSKEYKRLMQNAEEYHKNSSLYSRARDLMSAPVRRIDEVLALPYSVNDFREQEVPPYDDDSWLYNGEEELNFSLLERQKEMELYDLKHKKKGKGKGN
ncbi:hypothetical protein L6164_020511 [Bauhinia variegata]|uniref:Uncharacterized protein n=1 Tax=Bauhinia variegata TaxID=167791 RepID=A0ACB9N058_BAUVA|nr:hypothetical protein L6164_020511 [Bauhinia variegata]